MKKINSVMDIQELKKKRNKPCQDHLGNQYSSIKEMCEHYNINRKLFEYRINHGYTLEETLTLDRYKVMLL